MIKNKQNELTDRNESLEKVIQEVRNACAIEGHSAAEWKKTAEAIALKYVPGLQPKKPPGRPLREYKLFSAEVVANLADVAYHKHKFEGISDRKAVELSATSWSTFKRCKRSGPIYWQHFRDHPENLEGLKQLCTMLRADAKEIRAGLTPK